MLTDYSKILLEKYLKKGDSILELGNQILDVAGMQGIVSKEYWESKGHKCISLDINGLNGALPVDLCEDIKEDLGQFDIVTNFGTSEHVEDLFSCFKNIHKLCKVGGITIHENPKTGNFPEHGYHYLTLEFYNKLCKKTGYEILELLEAPAYHNTIDGWQIVAVLRKTKETFIQKNQFPFKDVFTE